MNPSTATAKEDISRSGAKCADWLMRAFGSGMRLFKRYLFVAAIFAIIYIASVATAAIVPVEFGGRWLAERHKLTLDVSRCGIGWCGVEVTNGSLCGRTVLRLDAGPRGPDDEKISGRLQLAAETEPYGIQAVLLRRGDALVLTMSGHTGGMFHTARRTFDFQDVFARIGDPVCKPDTKVS